MEKPESNSYLAAEMDVTEILEKLDSLKQSLIQFADKFMHTHNQPLCDLEETIAHVHYIRENLKKVDLSFYDQIKEIKAS